MIKSMTAFATTETTAAGLTVTTEIRSYNSRHLDIALRISNGYLALEDKIKRLVAAHVGRGRVEIRVQIVDDSDAARALEIDWSRAEAYYAALEELRTRFDLKGDISLELFAGAADIVKRVETSLDRDALWPAVENGLRQALDELEAMRQKEGAFIARDIMDRLDHIGQILERVKNDCVDLLPFYQNRLKERIAALTRDTVEIDAARVAQEAAILADRSDISEEIVRAASHLEQFRDIMAADAPGGRKLNFLLQELNREFNTMGAKIGNAELAHVIIAAKAELEKIREQIQNVE